MKGIETRTTYSTVLNNVFQFLSIQTNFWPKLFGFWQIQQFGEDSTWLRKNKKKMWYALFTYYVLVDILFW